MKPAAATPYAAAELVAVRPWLYVGTQLLAAINSEAVA